MKKIILITMIGLILLLLRGIYMEETKEKVDLILFWGQSNMVGYNYENEDNTYLLKNIDDDIVNNNESYSRVLVDLPEGVAFEYRKNSNELVDISTNPYTYGEKIGNSIYYSEVSGGTNMVPYFAKTYYEKTGHKLVVVLVGKGGMDIEKFLPNSDTGLYQLMVDKYNDAIKYLNKNNYSVNNKFYVVYQGESDAKENLVNNYQQNYEIVHNSLIKDLDLSFGAMVYIVRGDIDINDHYIQTIREKQKELVNKYDNLIMGTDYPYEELANGNDSILCTGINSIHLNAAGLSQVGRDIATNIYNSNLIK